MRLLHAVGMTGGLVFMLAASGCSAGDVQVTDVVRDVRDAVEPLDTGLDTPSQNDVQDTSPPRDVPPDRPATSDVPIVTDTGPLYCPDVCRSDAECQTLCPTPAAGYHYCCQLGPGGGSCSQRASACTTTDPVGQLGAACSVDTDCYLNGANCCLRIGSAGTCGCTGTFGCNPPMLCP